MRWRKGMVELNMPIANVAAKGCHGNKYIRVTDTAHVDARAMRTTERCEA
ncbi:hypothetical protein FACS18945_4900 [Bacteroidia bacterium]|nr:hypothetical protein FACS18945_4900 [Bacteroidia bacterium]